MEQNKTGIYVILGIVILLVGAFYYGAFDSLMGGDDTISVRCYNEAKELVDCPEPGTFAIYQGTPGIFYIAHDFLMDNTGNVDLIAYIKQATCKDSSTGLSNAECENSYANVVGSTYSKSVVQGSSATWNGDLITLQNLDGTYDVLVEICGADVAGELTEVCKTATTSFSSTPEGINFDIIVSV